MMRPTIVLLRVYVVAMTILPSQCQPEKEGYTYIFMKYVIEIGSAAMTYIPSFVNAGSGIQKLKGGEEHRYTDRKLGDVINLFLCF